MNLAGMARAAARADRRDILGSEAEVVALEAINLQLALGVTNEDALRHAAVDAVREEARLVAASYGLRTSGARFARYWAAPGHVEHPDVERVLEELAVQQSLARLTPDERALLGLLGHYETRRAVAVALGKDEWTIGKRIRKAIDHFLEVYRDEGDGTRYPDNGIRHPRPRDGGYNNDE